MKSQGIPRLPLIALTAITFGCASVPPDADFPQVRQAVEDRIDQRVVWRRGGEADAAVDVAVRALLARPMTPDEAVQVALLNNRRLQATYEDLMVAQADLVQAGLLSNPIFDAEILLESGQSAGLELSLVQDFLEVFYLPLRKRIAGARFEAAKLEVTQAVLDTAHDARSEAVDLIAAGQRVELRRTVLEAMEASYDLAQRLHAAGNTTDLSLALQRAQYEQAKLDLADAESAYIERRERMNVMLGLWGPATQRWAMIERLPDPEPLTASELAPEGLVARAVEASPGLAASRYRLEALGARLGLARSEALLPGLEAGAKGEREVGSGEWVAGPVFEVPIPLFDRNQASRARVRAEVRREQAAYYARAVELRAAVRAAYARMQTARAQVDYYQRVMLPLRAQIVNETLLQYNAMQVGAFELLQAKQMQIETGARYVDALAEYWRTHATLTSVVSGGSAEMGNSRQMQTMSTSMNGTGSATMSDDDSH